MSHLRTLRRIEAQRGITVTELVVAAGLLIVALSLVTSLAVRSGRLRQDTRHYRLAVDELSNQLDRLTVLGEPRLTAQLAVLAPSAQIREILPHPTLSATRLSDTHGDRIVLQLSWDRLGKSRPVTLVGWIAPPPSPTPPATDEGKL